MFQIRVDVIDGLLQERSKKHARLRKQLALRRVLRPASLVGVSHTLQRQRMAQKSTRTWICFME